MLRLFLVGGGVFPDPLVSVGHLVFVSTSNKYTKQVNPPCKTQVQLSINVELQVAVQFPK